MEKKEEFIRVGTTLYKIVDQPRIDGGYVRKRIAWNSETLRQDYGKDVYKRQDISSVHHTLNDYDPPGFPAYFFYTW